MKTRVFLSAFLGIVWIFAFPKAGYCRWATERDAPAAIDFENDDIEVDSDGTFSETIERQMEILKDPARRDQGAKRIYYNASSSRFKLLKAEVINDGKRAAVDSSSIEDKPLASRGLGFDQINQVMVAFPDIKTGSKTYLKISEQTHEVPFAGFYSKRFHFDGGVQTRTRRIRIVSELPLFVEAHDPFQALLVVESRKGSRYVLEVTLSKPVYEAVLDEETPSVLSSERTWVVVSSTRSHAEMVKSVLPRYEAILDSPLPPLFAKIRQQAAEGKTTVEKINLVTSNLAQNVRYMGDWRTVEGGFVPRGLERVAQTQFGDCKDFASVTAAILRKLGINAHVAWVERDAQPDLLPAIPLGEAFNHAIVRAKADGKVYWVDPTNFQSFAQGIFPDIIGRQSLVLEPGLEKPVDAIPAGRPEDSHYDERFSLEFDKDGDAVFDVNIADSGRMALSMTGASLQHSKESLDHSIVTSIVKPSHIKEFKVVDYDLSSRVVGDLGFSMRVKTKNSFLRTSAGFGYQLQPPAHIEPLLNLDTRERASGYFIAQPMTYTSEYSLKNIRIIGKEYRGCDLKSPWMNVRRSFRRESGGLHITEGYEIITSRIGIGEIKSERFASFQASLQKCFDRIQVIFAPIARSVSR